MEKDKISATCQLLVIGGSAGSIEVLLKILPGLSASLTISIVIVLHRKRGGDFSLAELFATRTMLKVKEIDDKDALEKGCIYVAPPDYHLLFEKDKTLSLDYSEKVNYSRPSIDVSFESACDVFGSAMAALLLSGANADGVNGLYTIKKNGGLVTVQNPATAESPYMPGHAVAKVKVDHVLNVEDMAAFINGL